jgi:signal transduction histidine kinase
MTTPLALLLRAPFTRRAWQQLAYLGIGAPLGVLTGGYALACVYLGVLSALTVIGFPLIALGLLAARKLAAVHRRLARTLLHVQVDDPGQTRPPPGFVNWVKANVSNPTAGRSFAYLLLKLPIAIIGAAIVVAWADNFLAIVSPVLWSANQDRPLPGPFDHWPGPLFLCLLGILAVFVMPWLVRAFVGLDAGLVRWLLGPSPGVARVRQLEKTRAQAVDDAAAMLRRIERDLHDGAQARLVGLGMSLTMLRDGLSRDPVDVETLTAQVDAARDTTKEAIAELRDLVRGIHPPVLDNGLADAVRSLAARTAGTVEIDVVLEPRPAPAIESILYFCAAELLANTGKHSGAGSVRIDAHYRRDAIVLRVVDDGHGGARPDRGGGLAGLADRLGTVDGWLSIDSPDGGPTIVTVEIPAAR